MRLSEILAKINQGESLPDGSVSARQRLTLVYSAGSNLPGYLPLTGPTYHVTEREALSALWFDWFDHNGRSRAPRGYSQSRDCPPDDDDGTIYWIDTVFLADIL